MCPVTEHYMLRALVDDSWKYLTVLPEIGECSRSFDLLQMEMEEIRASSKVENSSIWGLNNKAFLLLNYPLIVSFIIEYLYLVK